MEQSSPFENPTEQSKSFSESDKFLEIVNIAEAKQPRSDQAIPEQIKIGDDRPGERLEWHVKRRYWQARAESIRGLQLILAGTILCAFVGIIWLSLAGHSIDVVREITQTAVAAEVTLLASALAKPES